MIEGLGQGSAALPPIDRAALPAELRDASKEDQRLYQAALGFERVLTAELTKSMTRSAEAAGDDEESQTAAGGAYRDMLSEALADSVAAKGGIGLAQELFRTMKAQQR